MNIKGTYKKVVSSWQVGNGDSVLAASGNQLIDTLMEIYGHQDRAVNPRSLVIYPLAAGVCFLEELHPNVTGTGKQRLSIGADNDDNLTYPLDEVGAM